MYAHDARLIRLGFRAVSEMAYGGSEHVQGTRYLPSDFRIVPGSLDPTLAMAARYLPILFGQGANKPIRFIQRRNLRYVDAHWCSLDEWFCLVGCLDADFERARDLSR
jgi:hypothetical protein